MGGRGGGPAHGGGRARAHRVGDGGGAGYPGETTSVDVPPAEEEGERRSSGLRILSKRRRDSGDEGVVLVEVQPPSDDEGVRVLGEVPVPVAAAAPSVDEIFSRMRAERETAVAGPEETSSEAPASGDEVTVEEAAPAEAGALTRRPTTRWRPTSTSSRSPTPRTRLRCNGATRCSSRSARNSFAS